MEELTHNLENGEQLLWTGKSVSSKMLDKTNCPMYLVRILLPLVIMVVMMILSFNKSGGFKTSSFVMLLIIGLLVPLAAVLDGTKAKKLEYAATDRRIVVINESQLVSAYYDEIGECTFREDDDGMTSLLCGEKGMALRPAQWRGRALFSGEIEKDKNNKVEKYVMYAINDPEGLKRALNGKVSYTEA